MLRYVKVLIGKIVMKVINSKMLFIKVSIISNLLKKKIIVPRLESFCINNPNKVLLK